MHHEFIIPLHNSRVRKKGAGVEQRERERSKNETRIHRTKNLQRLSSTSKPKQEGGRGGGGTTNLLELMERSGAWKPQAEATASTRSVQRALPHISPPNTFCQNKVRRRAS
jgi:hypothetical protein